MSARGHRLNQRPHGIARAQVAPKLGTVTAHIETADLGMPALQPYLAQYTSMTLLKGTLGAKLDIERQADGVLAVQGNTWISGLHTVDNALQRVKRKVVSHQQSRAVPS